MSLAYPAALGKAIFETFSLKTDGENMDHLARDITAFFSSRQPLETNVISRFATVQQAFDRFLRDKTHSELGLVFQQLQLQGSDEVFHRFSHILDVSPFDLDLQAMVSIEMAGKARTAAAWA